MKGECFRTWGKGNIGAKQTRLSHLPFLGLGFLICKNGNNIFFKVLVESLNEKSMCEASKPGRLDTVFSVSFQSFSHN